MPAAAGAAGAICAFVCRAWAARSDTSDRFTPSDMTRLRALVGFHAVSARMRHDASTVAEIYVDGARHDARMRRLIAQIEAAGIPLLPVDTRRPDGLSGHASHQGVVAMATPIVMATSLDDLLDALPAGVAPLLL